MADSISFIHRVRYTPLGDLMRGRLTGRLGWLSSIDAAAIPDVAKHLIRRVVAHTRLWNREKRAVAMELIAHFSDGLTTGASAEELVDRFGDAKQAARLIRRAKVRNRPIVWHAFRIAFRVVAVLCIVYIALSVRYWIGRPSPSVDYLAIIDNPSLAARPEDRAWPLYREALAQIFPNGRSDVEAAAAYLNAETKTREWTAALAWIRTHRDAINLMHRAARRPMLGYIFRSPQPDERLRPLDSAGAPWPSGDTALASLELPEKDLRLISELLLLDGWARIEQNDASGIESVQSLLRLAEQSKAVSFDDVNQVGLSSWTKALNLVELALTQHPTLWSDEQLATLAHQLCIPRVQADFMDVDHPRLLAYDAIQRAYTDNGLGDGRITPAARQALDHRDKAMFWLIDRNEERWFAGLSWLLASRAETIDAYNAIRAQVVCDLRRPFRETLGEDSSSGMSRRKFSTWISRVRFQTLWLPGTRRMHSDYYLGRRDGVVVGIALELYRRDHDQQYPHTLNQLVPKYLPETPEDRITGGPLHYLLRDGRPIVYSAGGDGDDDGGRLPPRRGGLSGNIWAASWPRPGDDIRSTPDGDWVLYPEPDPRD